MLDFGIVSPEAQHARDQAGRMLRDWMDRWGYTAPALAKRCHISPRTVNQWMRGARRPPVLLKVTLELLEDEIHRKSLNI
jgi:transcriptional regulator with XRE-family HTH domain